MKRVFLIFLLTGILGLVLLPGTSFILAKPKASDCSQYCKNPGKYDPPAGQVCLCNPLQYEKFEDLVNAIINFIFTLSLAIVPLMIIIGAFYILTAGGEEKRVATGKNIITYTLIAFAIILLAKGLVALIKQIIGV